jgi:hypothetical protein
MAALGWDRSVSAGFAGRGPATAAALAASGSLLLALHFTLAGLPDGEWRRLLSRASSHGTEGPPDVQLANRFSPVRLAEHRLARTVLAQWPAPALLSAAAEHRLERPDLARIAGWSSLRAAAAPAAGTTPPVDWNRLAAESRSVPPVLRAAFWQGAGEELLRATLATLPLEGPTPGFRGIRAFDRLGAADELATVPERREILFGAAVAGLQTVCCQLDPLLSYRPRPSDSATLCLALGRWAWTFQQAREVASISEHLDWCDGETYAAGLGMGFAEDLVPGAWTAARAPRYAWFHEDPSRAEEAAFDCGVATELARRDRAWAEDWGDAGPVTTPPCVGPRP